MGRLIVPLKAIEAMEAEAAARREAVDAAEWVNDFPSTLWNTAASDSPSEAGCVRPSVRVRRTRHTLGHTDLDGRVGPLRSTTHRGSIGASAIPEMPGSRATDVIAPTC